MHEIRKLMAGAIALLLVFAPGSPAFAQDGQKAAQTRAQLDAAAERSLRQLLVEHADAKALYEESYGHAVFKATKGGLLLTGAGGSGVAVSKGGDRVYMHMGSAGVGVGAGLQTMRLVFLFADEASFDSFVNGAWDASAAAQAAAGKAGRNPTSSFKNSVAVFQITDKGLMAQADISGSKFWVSDRLNTLVAADSQ